MAGRVTFMFYPIVGIADQVSAKRLKVLAVGTPRPHADFRRSISLLERSCTPVVWVLHSDSNNGDDPRERNRKKAQRKTTVWGNCSLKL